jgi:hypothetical protein
MQRPFPSTLIRRAPNPQAADMNGFEFPVFERPHLIGHFKTLQDCVRVAMISARIYRTPEMALATSSNLDAAVKPLLARHAIPRRGKYTGEETKR